MSFSSIYVKKHKKMKRKKRVKIDIDDFALVSYKTFRVRELVGKNQKSVHETIFRAPLLFHHFCHITNSTEIYFVWGLKTKSLYVEDLFWLFIILDKLLVSSGIKNAQETYLIYIYIYIYTMVDLIHRITGDITTNLIFIHICMYTIFSNYR